MIGSFARRGNKGRSLGRLRLATLCASLAALCLVLEALAGDDAPAAPGAEAEPVAVVADLPAAVAACQSVDDPLDELLDQPQSRPGRVVIKLRKRYPVLQPPSRRKGREPLITTLFNVHEDEALPIFRDARPPPELFAELFRCRGFGTRVDLAPALIDAVIEAAEHFEAARVEVVSAYRSSKFNDSLAKKGRRVAAESRHTRGEAIDFRLVGTETLALGAWLSENFEGGVGTYAGDEFVHIDLGRKRRWKGR